MGPVIPRRNWNNGNELLLFIYLFLVGSPGWGGGGGGEGVRGNKVHYGLCANDEKMQG